MNGGESVQLTPLEVPGAAATPGGVINSVQFNNPLGTFDGDATFTYDTATGILTVGDPGGGGAIAFEQVTAGALRGMHISNDDFSMFFSSDEHFRFLNGSEVRAYPGDGSGALFAAYYHDGTDGFLDGTTQAGGDLNLRGADTGVADQGRINVNSPLEFFYSEGNTVPAEQSAVRWRPVFTTAGAYIGGWMANNAAITYTNSFYIYSSVQDNSFHTSNAGAGFQAWVLFNALATIQNGTSSDLVQIIVLNDGCLHQRITSGVSTSNQHITISSVGAIHADVSGATMTLTGGYTGIQVGPKWNCVAGGTINLNNVTGLQMFEPTVALFQTNAGTRNVANIRGIDFPQMVGATGYTLSGERSVVYSAMTDSAVNFFLNNPGGARSDFGGGLLLDCGFVQCFADNVGLSLGAGGGDVIINWNGASLEFDPVIGEDMRITFATDIQTFTSASVSEDSAINFNYPKGAFGEAGAPGNNKYRFVANAETVTIGGGFSQFLLTQSANDTLDAGIGQYAGWTINAPTPVIGSGSLTDSIGLLIGGNPNTGTNRYGLQVLSNPSGGTLNYCARFQGAAGVLIDGILEHAGSTLGFYGSTPAVQSAAYTRNAAIVEDRTLLASASATTLNNNNVLAALIADLQAIGLLA